MEFKSKGKNNLSSVGITHLLSKHVIYIRKPDGQRPWSQIWCPTFCSFLFGIWYCLFHLLPLMVSVPCTVHLDDRATEVQPGQLHHLKPLRERLAEACGISRTLRQLIWGFSPYTRWGKKLFENTETPLLGDHPLLGPQSSLFFFGSNKFMEIKLTYHTIHPFKL